MPREKSAAIVVSRCCLALLCAVVGCGTTRTSNTARTATEQLLISDAIDRAVQTIDFSPLRGQSVFFDDRQLFDAVDDTYLISSLRQHILASGCILKEKKEEATFIVEPRAGAIGTDNHDLLFGMPAATVPQFGLLTALPSAIPEIPIAKRRNQRGVAKIAIFAYYRETGEPAWQSGITTEESTSNDIWVLGAGPFKRGTIHQGTSFAGGKLPTIYSKQESKHQNQVVQVTQQAVFNNISRQNDPSDGKVQQVAALEPVTDEPIAEPIATDENAEAQGPPVIRPPVQAQ
ncbi:MAG: hypothetical protein GXP26_05415 [Planctomycetes bacterium]|nr:hypothetical protein [Planctomycetota bacterium]